LFFRKKIKTCRNFNISKNNNNNNNNKNSVEAAKVVVEGLGN
jgi:hypothetical protein